ncbi:MAG: hypothetical protein HYU74_04295, partial [Dechloromonas sp.]|nr:hypothetical protein [Dechloromonas sp.]
MVHNADRSVNNLSGADGTPPDLELKLGSAGVALEAKQVAPASDLDVVVPEVPQPEGGADPKLAVGGGLGIVALAKESPTERALRTFHQVLGHLPHGVTELHQRSTNGDELIAFVDGEDAFVELVLGALGHVAVGLQPRPRLFLDRAPNRFVAGCVGCRPDEIVHLTVVGLEVSSATEVRAVRAARFKTTEPLCLAAGDRGLIAAALSPLE